MNCQQTFDCQWEGHCETIEAIHRTEQSEVKQCQHKVLYKCCTTCNHYDIGYRGGFKCNAFDMVYPNDRACFGWEAKR